MQAIAEANHESGEFGVAHGSGDLEWGATAHPVASPTKERGLTVLESRCDAPSGKRAVGIKLDHCNALAGGIDGGKRKLAILAVDVIASNVGGKLGA